LKISGKTGGSQQTTLKMSDEAGFGLHPSTPIHSSPHLLKAPPSESVLLLRRDVLPVSDDANVLQGEILCRDEEEKEKTKLYEMDGLLNSMGSPGRYQVLIFLALASSMFPVVFNDLCSIFYTVHPLSSTCWVPVKTGNLYVISSSSSNSSSFTTIDSTLHGIQNSSVMLNIVYGSSESCNILDALPEGSPEADSCWNSMQHQFKEARSRSIISQVCSFSVILTEIVFCAKIACF
jgi:hypothetical protein